jgi:hypothetical protein
VFTYYLKEPLKTRKQRRQEAEKEAERRKAAATYPSRDDIRAEEEEEPPAVILTVSDATGRVVRRLSGPFTSGVHRVNWDLRYPAPMLPPPRPPDADDPFGDPPSGHLVMPGRFKVTMAQRVGGVLTPLAGAQEFTVIVEGQSAMTPADRAALVEFQQKVGRLQRAVSGALETANQLKTRLGLIKRAIQETPAADNRLMDDAMALDRRTNEILRALRGDNAFGLRNENLPPSITARVFGIVGEQRMSTSRPTQTQAAQYQAAAQEFEQALASLKTLMETDLVSLEKAMEAAGAPWTPGRIPEWRDN